MRFKSQPGMERSESVWWRILYAVPLLIIFGLAALYMGPQHWGEVNLAEVAATSGWLEDVGRVPVKMNYTGFQGFESFVRVYVTAFTPGMAGLEKSEFSSSKFSTFKL